MKEFLRGMVNKTHMTKRLILCLLGVCMIGIGISWFNIVGWGADACSAFGLAIADKLNISFGNYLAMFNIILFVILFWKGKNQIGIGTVLNMFLVGYVCDFMTWIREQLWPDFAFPNFGMRLVVMILTSFIFVFGVALYMMLDLGTAPYDALAFVIFDAQKKLPFRVVRILWDASFALLAIALGGKIGLVTVLMVLSVGPAASAVGKKLEKYLS